MASGYLTTHVLNTAKGIPAAGIKIDLYNLAGEDSGGDKSFVRTLTTNSDGRTDSPILPKEEFACGSYQLDFHVGDYLKSQGLDNPLFFDTIPIVFNITDENAHYHVPLLLSPFGYSTYRGS